MVTFEIKEQYTSEGYRYKIETKHLNYNFIRYGELAPSMLIDKMYEITEKMNNVYNEDCDFVVG